MAFLLGPLSYLLARAGFRAVDAKRELPALALLCLFNFLLEAPELRGGRLSLNPRGMAESLDATLRFVAAFLIGRLFYQSTPASELREAAAAAGSLLPGRLGEDAGLLLSLVLGFVPSILEAYRASSAAARARGVGPRPSLSLRLAILEALIRRLALDAVTLPEILAARGWTPEGRTAARPWDLASALAVGAAGLLALAGILGLL